MQTFQEISQKLSRSISVKIAIIGFLILVLLIPANLIQGLIEERQNTCETVVSEVNDKWGGSQTISGPIMCIPYFDFERRDKELVKVSKTLYLLPEKLDIDGQVNPEIRYRGIYKVIVYKSDINFNSVFQLPDLNLLGITSDQVEWDKTSILFGISDLRGIQNEIKISIDNNTYDVNPGINHPGIATSGFTCNISMNSEKSKHSVQLELELSGSENLYFTPVGKTTNVDLNSPWSTPSFTGSFLPDNHSISGEGFEANWTILELNRNFPQVWNNKIHSISQASFGVNLIFAVDEYQKSMRSAKYAVMFIALTFLIYLFVEIINKKRIHPVQYLLVSFALLLFYTLLISLSEQIGFNLAYLVSAMAIIGLISIYSFSIFKSGRLTRIISISLMVLYAFLFTILQLEDYALLLGSIGLFIILAFVMYLSKRINWFGQINDELEEKN